MNTQFVVRVLFFSVSLAAVCPLAIAAPIDEVNVTVPKYAELPSEVPELKEAQDLYRKGNVDEALEMLEEATRRQSNLPPAQLMMARLHLSHNQIALGRSLLEQTAIDHREHPEVYLLFGNLALAEGQLTDAILHYERALEVGTPADWPENQKKKLEMECHAGRAIVAERRKDWPVAVDALTDWMKLDAMNPNVRDRLGTALFMAGDDRSAFEQYQAAARMDDKMNPAEVSMGVMYGRRGDYEKASQWFGHALKKYPRDARVHYELAGVALIQDRAGEAKQHADKAAEMGLENMALTMQRGLIARQLKDWAQAEKFFSQAVQESPGDFEAMNQLALVLAEQPDEDKRQRALEFAQFNARQYPRSTQSLSTLGWVLYKLGRYDEAEQTLRTAAANPQVRRETIYFLARVLEKNARKDHLKKAYDRIQDLVNEPGLFILRPEARQWLQTAKVD